MNFLRRGTDHEAHFDLTAMIDVVLLLIVFFVFTVHFARTTAQPLDLPTEPGADAPADSDRTVIIELAKDGQLNLIGSRPAPLTEIVDAVRASAAAGRIFPAADSTSTTAAAAGRPASALDLVIRADKDAAAKHLNQLAAALAAAGIREWRLATSGNQ